MMTAFKALIIRDIRLFFLEPRAALMFIVFPIVIASFFGYIFGGSGGASEVSAIPVFAVDGDGSAISRGIVGRLAADKALTLKSGTAQEAREAVRKGKATVAFLIPPGFGASAGQAFFSGGAKPEVGLLYDPSRGVEMGMVKGILTGHAMEAVSEEMFGGETGRQMVKDALPQIETSTGLTNPQKESLRALLNSVEQLNEQAGAPGGVSMKLGMPYDVRAEAVTSGTGVVYNGYGHSFGGVGVQFILMSGIEIGVGLLLQRQRGLWKRLRAAPISRSLLLGSRAVSSALISMFVLLVLFGFARAAFGVRITGSVAGFLAVCASFSLMTAAFGLLIAALGKTPDATRNLAIVVTLLMVMLGGAWVPTFVFPRWLQSLTIVVPTRWAVDGLDAMTWRGLGFYAAVVPVAGLLGCALLFGAVAVMRFRWEADG